MKLLFAGTPQIAVPSLNALTDSFEVVGVLCAPDAYSGRGKKRIAQPVKIAAEKRALPVLQPERLDAETRLQVAALGARLLVVFAYGRLFGPRFLALFPEGGINLHPSALPRFRGPSPISAAILAGCKQTAISVQRVALEMDAGDILVQKSFPLKGDETTAYLGAALSHAAVPELIRVVRDIIDGSLNPIPQNESEATYCKTISKDDGLIDWEMPASQLERMVRAYNPWPTARTSLHGKSLAVLEASLLESPPFAAGVPGTVLGIDRSRGILIQTGRAILVLRRLQLASRKSLDFQAFLNGTRLKIGTVLGVHVNEK